MTRIPTIGIEMHCEMKSRIKVFSQSENIYSTDTNNHVALLDIALPGVLPVLNQECVLKAIMAASILNCQIPEVLSFDRKNYYYPDLPKGYQITQFFHPIGENGKIIVPFKEEEFEVLIHDIHLEEDSAQLDHLDTFSTINYNRAGVPLLELVTEPCFHSKEEVIAFLEYMRRVYQYTDISDADATKGQIRCDVNISLSETDTLGTKVEVKNVNSFANVASVIDYEISRLNHLFENGKSAEIEQETRRWNEETESTIHMRSKADAIDYKYFPEPNIPNIKLNQEWINCIQKSIPILPFERLKKYTSEYGISFVEANIILKEKELSNYFDECLKNEINPQIATNWLTGVILSHMNNSHESITEISLKPQDLKFVLDKMNDGTISSKQAKEVVNQVLIEKKTPQEYITHENAQISDETELEKLVDEIIEKNPHQLESYRSGKTNLFEFFIGQVMKETKGKANPIKTRELVSKKIN